MKSITRSIAVLAVAFAALCGAASAQTINPATDIRWPSCTTGQYYEPFNNACASGASGGVTQIVAGTNVTISPSGGTGAVTINASGSGSIPSPSSATVNYYVATTGSDSNPCSSASPCLTIGHALTLIPAFMTQNYTINIADGTYAECPEISSVGNPAFGFSGIALELLGNDTTPANVQITGQCTFTPESVGGTETAGLYAHSATNLIVDGVTVAPSTSSSEAIKVDGQRRFVFKNSTAQGTVGAGMAVTGGSKVVLAGTVKVSNYTGWGIYVALSGSQVVSDDVTLTVTPAASGATACLHAELSSNIDIEGGTATITCGSPSVSFVDVDTDASIYIGLNVNASNASTPAGSVLWYAHRGGVLFEPSTITAANFTNQCKVTEPGSVSQGAAGRTFTNVGASSTANGGACLLF